MLPGVVQVEAVCYFDELVECRPDVSGGVFSEYVDSFAVVLHAVNGNKPLKERIGFTRTGAAFVNDVAGMRI